MAAPPRYWSVRAEVGGKPAVVLMRLPPGRVPAGVEWEHVVRVEFRTKNAADAAKAEAAAGLLGLSRRIGSLPRHPALQDASQESLDLDLPPRGAPDPDA